MKSVWWIVVVYWGWAQSVFYWVNKQPMCNVVLLSLSFRKMLFLSLWTFSVQCCRVVDVLWEPWSTGGDGGEGLQRQSLQQVPWARTQELKGTHQVCKLTPVSVGACVCYVGRNNQTVRSLQHRDNICLQCSKANSRTHLDKNGKLLNNKSANYRELKQK